MHDTANLKLPARIFLVSFSCGSVAKSLHHKETEEVTPKSGEETPHDLWYQPD